jgi:hypothetical protein
MGARQLCRALLERGCHQTDVGDAFHDADPAWLLRLELEEPGGPGAASRLATVARDLVTALERAGDRQRRDVAEAVSSWVVQRAGLADPRVDVAQAALREQRVGEGPERDAMRRLAEQLDGEAWDARERSDAGPYPPQRYLDLFARARAASSVWNALDPDPLVAALEAVYEAQAATGDLEEVRRLVTATLG